MSNIPEELKYTKEHEWVKLEGDIATVGITDHAQSELGDVVFVEMPDVGTKVAQGNDFGVVESVKTVSNLYAPLSGEVTEINNGLESAPDTINKDPYNDGWIIKVKLDNVSELESILDKTAYSQLLEA